jgi:PAS domain S-box-containing protein
LKRKKASVFRKFGLELVGNVPWGTHLCQFYETKEDLIAILVPYFAEGLRNNEFCMWVTSLPLEAEEAKQALKKSVPELDQYFQKGQIEILPYTEWYLLGGSFNSDRVLQDWIRKEKAALDSGFDGLRLTGNTFWLERNGWKAFTEYEEQVNKAIGQHKMIAVCTYSLDKCNANEVIDVVKNHQFALIKRSEKWELIESSETKKVQRALLRTEKKFSTLYSSMTEGMAFHDVVYDSSGKAVDYVITDVNPAFEKITGLPRKQAIGKRASELYGTGEPPYLDVYEKVASSGKPASFETYFAPMQKHFSISVLSPSKGKFTTIFHDVTQYRQAEEKLRNNETLLKSFFDSPGVMRGIVEVINDSDIKHIKDNEVTASYIGLTPADLQGKLSSELGEPRERIKVWLEHYKQCQLSGQPVRFEYLDRQGSKESCLVATVIYIGTARSGYPRFAYIVADITERKKAEDVIRILNERFEMAQRAAGAGVWDWNTKTGHIEWTPEMFRLLGLDPQKEKASFEVWTAVLHPEDRERAATKIDQALKTHSFLNNEYRVVRPDGKIVWINALGQGEYDDQNQPTRMSGICMDITERKKTEKTLSERENDLNRAQTVAKTGSWRLDVRRNQLLWSDETYRMFGIPKGTPLTYETFLGAVHPSDKEYVNQKWEEALRGAPYDIEHRIVVDGKVKWVREKAEMEFDKDGKMVGGFGTVQDITERKEMQNKLEEYSKNLEKLVEERTKKLELSSLYARSLIEASLDPLVTINVEGKITDVNKATELATGCSREQLIGSDFSDYFTEPEKARTGYKTVFAEGFVRDYSLAIRHTSGKTTDVLYNASIYRNAQSEIQGVFAAARDITELKKAEEKVQESIKMLQDAERLAAIGATAGMVGHDIRNPLQSIISEVYLVKMDLASLPDSEEKEGLQESIEAIEKQTTYINKIILDLQDFAKPLNPHAEETDIETIINELLLRNGVSANIQTDAKVDDNARTMMADSAYIKRIIGNLVSNAVQAMPNGGKLTLCACREAGDIVITVEDTGVGISEEAKPKLFLPLFTTKAKGQGFGLSVVKRLTEALNGTITFESQEGKGTKFALRFPSPPLKKQINPN